MEYLQPLLSSVEPAVVLEAASGILALASVCGGELAAAPSLAFGALLDLWDADATGASHAQLMDVLSAGLGALHVRRQLPVNAACACPVLGHEEESLGKASGVGQPGAAPVQLVVV